MARTTNNHDPLITAKRPTTQRKCLSLSAHSPRQRLVTDSFRSRMYTPDPHDRKSSFVHQSDPHRRLTGATCHRKTTTPLERPEPMADEDSMDLGRRRRRQAALSNVSIETCKGSPKLSMLYDFHDLYYAVGAISLKTINLQRFHKRDERSPLANMKHPPLSGDTVRPRS
jgi:hypothetical protein